MQNFPKPEKLKIVLLGNRSVGKSSIIRRFILDDFIHDMQVLALIFSQLSVLITYQKPSLTKEKNTAWNFGIRQDKKNIDH